MLPTKRLFFSKFKYYFSLQNAIWLALILVFASSVFSQFNIRHSRSLVSHTLDVLEKIQKIESSLVSAQFELQQFSLDRDPIILDQYQTEIQTAQEYVQTLIQLTKDDSSQQTKISKFQTLLQTKTQQKQPFLEKFYSNPATQLSQSALLVFTNEMKQQLSEIREQEKRLLQKRRENTNFLGLFSSSIVIFGLVLTIILSLLIHQARIEQKKLTTQLNKQLSAVELQQELSSHLLTCRKFEEAYDILQSLWRHLLPNSFVILYQINNSRDQMMPTVVFGTPVGVSASSPRDCWALRRGEAQTKQHKTFMLPCTLCKQLHPQGIPPGMMCFPLQAHEQTIGILHLESVPQELQTIITSLIPQIALPLAVLHLQSELEYLSFHDANTGIYNRRFLDEMMARAIAKAQRLNYQVIDKTALYSVGIIFLDVDHFKKFNSEYGHEAGDKVLRILGGLLRDITRAGEDTACRYGGEEFVIIMPGASEKETFEKAEVIREAIQKQSAPGGQIITISLGIATYPKNGSTAEEVLRAANVALLKAKGEGRNQTTIAG